MKNGSENLENHHCSLAKPSLNFAEGIVREQLLASISLRVLFVNNCLLQFR